MMMLTLVTAKAMGVKNRLNPYQSIRGGAAYLKRMLSRLPDAIVPKERAWFALAAYNIGWGHLQDAMKLADRLGLSPYRWDSLRTVLPKLSEPRYYQTLRYGYARGREPVLYVARIQNYYQMLLHRFPRKREGS
jgi:membrane-bound lytic murein transglycosylase F